MTLKRSLFNILFVIILLFSFDKLSNTISKNMEMDLNKDIYVNFLALNRIEEHYKDIYNLKNNIGSILES